MARIHYVSFQEDIIERAMHAFHQEKVLFVFPTERNLWQARNYNHRYWEMDNYKLVTIDELKSDLFLTEFPQLEEDKRLLALYQSITLDQKTAYHLNSYFSSIQFLHSFFSLMEEMSDECIDTNTILENMRNENVSLYNWQEVHYNDLLAIRDQYRQFLQELQYEDKIFAYQMANCDLSYYSDIEQVVIINQFYYTTLEKMIIEAFQRDNKQVHLYYQLPVETKGLLNEKTLAIRPFCFNELAVDYRTKSITTTQCANDFGLVRALIQQTQAEEINAIVDIDFEGHPYSRMLSSTEFRVSQYLKFKDSHLYLFFHTLQVFLSMLQKNKNTIAYPIEALISILTCSSFIRITQVSEDQRTSLVQLLCSLLEEGILYIDTKFFSVYKTRNNIQREKFPLLADWLVTLQNCVSPFMQMRSVNDFLTLIKDDSVFVLQELISEEELCATDLVEVFYRTLANLQSIEELGIVTDWQDIFPNESLLSCQLLEFILSAFESRIAHIDIDNEQRTVPITTLHELRNLQNNTIIILNTEEGLLPSSRSSQFLFTEAQRKAIGLKTYEEIRLREKYYFFRTVLSSIDISFISIVSLMNNIQLSSFVDEIMLECNRDEIVIKQQTIEDVGYLSFLDNMIKGKHSHPQRIMKPDPSFFTIPFDPNVDCVPINNDYVFLLTFYPYQQFINNAFLYYLHNIARIKPYSVYNTLKLDNRVLGNIVHKILEKVWRCIQLPFDLQQLQEQKKLIPYYLEQVISTPTISYAIPYNYSKLYFDKVIKDVLYRVLSEVIDGFTELLTPKSLTEICVEMGINNPLNWFSVEMDNTHNLVIQVKAIADLILYSEEDVFLFDYKTGQANTNQLVFYCLCYFSLMENVSCLSVKPATVKIMEGKISTPLEKLQAKQEKLQNRLKECIISLLEDGFALSDKANLDYAPITRYDLKR